MKGIIDYSEIDEHCVGLVRYFNEIGLKQVDKYGK